MGSGERARRTVLGNAVEKVGIDRTRSFYYRLTENGRCPIKLSDVFHQFPLSMIHFQTDSWLKGLASFFMVHNTSHKLSGIISVGS